MPALTTAELRRLRAQHGEWITYTRGGMWDVACDCGARFGEVRAYDAALEVHRDHVRAVLREASR